MPSLATADTAQLMAFDGLAFGVALISHIAISIFVGLVYAAILPMFPRRPAVWGGFIAPLVWSGLLWASLGVINPALDDRIDWQWFVASQFAFGLAAGAVITHSQRIRTMQSLPFAARAGIEAPGLTETKDNELSLPNVLPAGGDARLLAACDSLPGKPTEADRPLRPAQVVDFRHAVRPELFGLSRAGRSLRRRASAQRSRLSDDRRPRASPPRDRGGRAEHHDAGLRCRRRAVC